MLNARMAPTNRRLVSSMVCAGAGLALLVSGCLENDGVRRQSGASGSAGASDQTPPGPAAPPETSPPGISIDPPTFDAGVATVGASFGQTCSSDGGSAMPPLPPGVRGGGPQPTIPATVISAKTPVPPISGGTLRALSDGKTAVAADPDRDQLYVIDLTNDTVRATVTLTAGDEPGRVIEDAAGRVHVALRRGGALVTLDPKTGTITARRAVCSAPRGLAYEAKTDLVHVACAGGELVSLPAAGGAATRTLLLDRDLRDVVIGKSGLLVSTFRKAEVLVLDATGKLTERLQPSRGVRPSIIGMPESVSPAVAWRMEALPDSSGGVLMLHQVAVDSPIDPSGGGYSGLKGCPGVVASGVSSLTPGVDNSGLPPTSGLGMVSLAVDLDVSSDGSKIALAVAGNTATEGSQIVMGSPASIVDNAGSCTMVGTPSLDVPQPTGQVVSVSFSSPTTLLAQTREPATLWRSDTGKTISLAEGLREDTGHMLFHVNAGGGLACASCHPEGGEDGRTWNFACQARRTQSIRGGISATAPFHWDGSENDFGKLMDDVFSGRMGGPQLGGDQKQALLDWIDTIPALPKTAGLDAAAVGRGQALFTDSKLACATCHAGTLLTNNQTVDVGTGLPVQVPSLRGVAWRAPYMHTGCASTLSDRFGAACGGGDKHGFTSQLTPANVTDLVAYLQSL